jgi:hypothetical protein
MTVHVDAALDLARRGFAVFQLKPRGKVPLVATRDGGHGCHDATKDQSIITEWWTSVPFANIGLATGRSSGIFVLDVDPRHGGDEALAELERRHGKLPETPVSITGGGGQHVFFRHEPGIGNSAGKVGVGLDVRGQGGYIVAPPSVHENGRPYAWDVDHHLDEVPIARAPDWLIDLLRTKPKNGRAEMPVSWRRLVADGVAEGRRNTAITRLAGHLLRKGVDPLVVLDLARVRNAERCRPPLDDAEVVKTVDSIAAAELRRRSATK